MWFRVWRVCSAAHVSLVVLLSCIVMFSYHAFLGLLTCALIDVTDANTHVIKGWFWAANCARQSYRELIDFVLRECSLGHNSAEAQLGSASTASLNAAWMDIVQQCTSMLDRMRCARMHVSARSDKFMLSTSWNTFHVV